VRGHTLSARARSESARKADWHKPRRATAMAAFAKSWRRGLALDREVRLRGNPDFEQTQSDDRL